MQRAAGLRETVGRDVAGALAQSFGGETIETAQASGSRTLFTWVWRNSEEAQEEQAVAGGAGL